MDQLIASLAVYLAVIVHCCSVGLALQDSTSGLCSCVLCMALIFQRDPREILYVSYSVVWLGNWFALLLP